MDLPLLKYDITAIPRSHKPFIYCKNLHKYGLVIFYYLITEKSGA
jgi:hypothetical protein